MFIMFINSSFFYLSINDALDLRAERERERETALLAKNALLNF